MLRVVRYFCSISGSAKVQVTNVFLRLDGRLTLLPPLARVTFVIALLSSFGWTQAATLEVQPGLISVSPSYSSVEARMVLRPGTSPPTNPSVSWLSNDGMDVEIGKPSTSAATKGQVIVWSVTIKNLNHARFPGAVLFDASWTSGAVVQHAFATLSLTSQADSAQKAVEASIEGNFDAVSQQRPGYAYLLVTNNLEIPIHVTVDTQVPRTIFQQPPPEQLDVPPRSATYTKIDLNAENRITPGVYPVLFSLKTEWDRAGKKEQRQLVLTKMATAGVFFESDLLKLLGVPSFLVLPGCLVLFTMQLFLTLGILGLKNDSRLPQLTISSPGFWIVAVSLSGVFALVYGSLTPNNYLLRYGVEDLRNVWLASVVIGASFYLLYAWLTLKNRRQHVPTANDEPLTLLRKMARNKVGIPPSKVRFKLASIDLEGHVVERIEDGMQSLWVAPLISIDWGETKEALKTQSDFENAINARLDWKQIADRLEKALRDQHVMAVRWTTGTNTSIQQPYHVKIEAITAYLQADRIFSVA